MGMRPLVRRLRPIARAALALLAAGALTGIMFNARHAWFHGGHFIDRDALLFLAFWMPLLLLARRRRRMAETPDSRSGAARARLDPALLCLLGGMLLTLTCRTGMHPWFYFSYWFRAACGSPRFLACGLERFVWAAALLMPLLLVRRRLAGWLLALLALAQLLSFMALLRYTDGMALYRDDHPSFMFRLYEYTRTFPAMTAFNPWWNAGVVNSVGASSGVGAIALPFFLLWRNCPVHSVYTHVVGTCLIVGMPLLALLALRVMRASWTAAAVAGLLALAVSRYFFVWALHFGTIGSSVAMSFLPLAVALTYRVYVLRRADWRTLAAWVLALFFLFQWPPGLLMAATMLAGALWNLRRWRWRSLSRLALAALALILLLLPNLLAIASNSNLLSFVFHNSSAHPVTAGAGDSLLAPWPRWREMFLETWGKRLIETHPIVVFLGLGGVLVLPLRRARRWLLPPIYLLLLLASWGPLLLPKMQLERMAIPAMLIAIVPAALWCGRLLRAGDPRLALPRAMLLALLAMGALATRQIYKNRTYAPFNPLPPAITNLCAQVRAAVPPDGRLLFLGRNVHAFGHGHIAYLPVLTQREMMACDYYAFPRGMVEYNYPPRPWRKSAAGIAAFMRLYGATHAISQHAGYISFLRAHDDHFEELPDRHGSGHSLFALRQPESGRFHSGTGRVEADCGFLRLQTPGPAEVVLRYNWSEGLTATPPGEIFPVAITNGITFIGVRTRDGAPVTIRHGRRR